MKVKEIVDSKKEMNPLMFQLELTWKFIGLFTHTHTHTHIHTYTRTHAHIHSSPAWVPGSHSAARLHQGEGDNWQNDYCTGLSCLPGPWAGPGPRQWETNRRIISSGLIPRPLISQKHLGMRLGLFKWASDHSHLCREFSQLCDWKIETFI